MSLGSLNGPVLRLRSAAGTWVACDFTLPTGSFKDRGAEVLVNLALELGADRIIVDSSGNAGASTAAYAARAGIDCDVYVPAKASAAKLRQIASYGATLRLISGPRTAARSAAERDSMTPGTLYATHAWNPFFIVGVARAVPQMLAQLPRTPARVVAPVGSGTLLLGLAQGFRAALADGLIDRMPRLVAAQSERCAPLAGRAPTNPPRVILAEGIAVARPPRLAQIRQAIRETRGSAVAVTDSQILQAQMDLAHEGFYVEPTAAVPYAASCALGQATDGDTLLMLTGSGLKSAQRTDREDKQ